MKKLDTNWYPDIIPGFDALAWKEKVQSEILEETKGMTDEEIRAFFRRESEAFREEQRIRRQGITVK